MGNRWVDQVDAAAHGNAQAFTRIYDLTAAEVRGQLLALQVDAVEARVQSAYVRYWVHLPRLRIQPRPQVVQWLVLTACRAKLPAPGPG